jgi:hypothetical protein
VNLSDKASLFGRFHAIWTPAVLVMSPKGEERSRIEGYLPRDEFMAELKMGLARVFVMGKRWEDAERWFDEVAREGTQAEAAAQYWRAVCRYNISHEATPLLEVAQKLKQEHPDSLWAIRASVWLPREPDQLRRAGA